MKKLFVSVVAVSLLGFSSFAFAINDTSISASTGAIANYSEEELVALIAKLQKQLELVRQNSVQCAIADVDLSLGDGEDSTSKIHTKNLQAFLKEKGYFKLEPTGYFGKITQTALLNFQKTNGLEQTGELSSSARAFIKTLKCKKAYGTTYKTEDTEKYNDDSKNSTTKTSNVSSITLASDGKTIKWSTVGYSKDGYKIVWSKNQAPTYPTREDDQYIYTSDPNANFTTLNAFNGSGTYYVRVCEYLGGKCGVYSNEISISL